MESKTITVSSIEMPAQNRIKIKDENNLTYTIFKTKQDGSNSAAYTSFNSLGVSVGKTITIGYTEKQGEYNGKPITYRNIMTIKEANATEYVKSQSPDAKEKRMSEGQSWGNAKTNATSVALKFSQNIEEFWNIWFNAANKIHNYEPDVRHQSHNTQPTDSPDSEINIEDIPF